MKIHELLFYLTIHEVLYQIPTSWHWYTLREELKFLLFYREDGG